MQSIMKTRILLIMTALLLWGCPDDNIDPPADLLKAFKASTTLRFEGAGNATVKNTDAKYLFYADRGGLFSSTKNKVGYASRDGSSYYFVEWSGDANVGTKSSPSLRTQSGTVNLHALEVVKSEGGLIWILYKQTASSDEGKVVQKW